MNKTIDALFPKIRQQILGTLLSNPEDWRYRSELSKELGIPQSSLQKELKVLIDSGILEARSRGNRVYFRPDKTCVIYGELADIATKTFGLVDVVRSALEAFNDKIALAFIFGSVARGTENSTSDIDLMLIGEIKLEHLLPTLKELEKKLNRDVNPHLMTVNEARNMLRSPNHFFATVISDPKVILIRNDDELSRVFEQRPSKVS